MQVFKAFYKSLRRQITSVLLYVIAFAAISVIMANTMSENTDTLFTAKRLTVAVFDMTIQMKAACCIITLTEHRNSLP